MKPRDFIALNIALLTVSDSRTAVTDRSGRVLRQRVSDSEHVVYAQRIVRDDLYQIRALISQWVSRNGIYLYNLVQCRATCRYRAVQPMPSSALMEALCANSDRGRLPSLKEEKDFDDIEWKQNDPLCYCYFYSCPLI